MTSNEETIERHQVYLTPLDATVKKADIRKEAEKYGDIVAISHTKPSIPRSGWAFVSYKTFEYAQNAVNNIHRKLKFPNTDEFVEAYLTCRKSELVTKPHAISFSTQGLWKQMLLLSGNFYYYNTITGHSQWDRPIDFSPLLLSSFHDPDKYTCNRLYQYAPPGNNIFVFHVPFNWDDQKLYDHFCKFGNIISSRVQCDRNGRNRGYGFVSYDNPESSAEAIKQMNGFCTGDKYLKVMLKRGDKDICFKSEDPSN